MIGDEDDLVLRHTFGERLKRVTADLRTVTTVDGGFTLFETLAATMVLAIALAVLLQLFSGGLRSGHLANMYTQAVWHAREKMEEALLLRDLSQPVATGHWEDGYSWQVQIVPLTSEAADGPKTSLIPCTVTVQVSWLEGEKERDITFQSITLISQSDDTF